MVVTTTSVTLAPGGRVRKLYKCSSCSRVFNRSEHCIRHERGHTQERPFECQFCHKTYARKDLVKRHEKTIHAKEYEAIQAASKDVEKPKTEARGSTTVATNSFPPTDAIPELEVENVAPDPPFDSAIFDLATPSAKQHSDEIPIDPELYSQLYNLPSPLPTDSPRWQSQGQDVPSRSRDVFDLDGLDFLDTMAVDEDSERSSKRPRLQSAPNPSIRPIPIDGLSETQQPLPDTFDISLFDEFFAMNDTLGMPNLPYTPSNSDVTSPGQNISSQGAQNTARNYQNPSLDHSQKLFRRLPHVLQDKSKCPHRLDIDQFAYETFCNNVRERMDGEDCRHFLPTIQDMRRFVGGYLDCFHRHLPIIHLPSLVVADTPSPLLLALSSIGALYQLDRRRAALSYQLSLNLLQKFEDQCCPTQSKAPIALWAVQTRLLLSYYAFFTGDSDLIVAEFSRLGFYLTDYRLRRALLCRRVVSADRMTWAGYVQRESHKRALCGINIMSNLAMVIYDITPGFVSPEHLDFEMPDDEQLWNAKSEDEWRQLWRARKNPPSRTLRSVLTDTISGHHTESNMTSDQPYHLSTFGGLVLMHAVCIHMWTSLQFTRAVGLYSNIGIVGNFNLREIVLSNAIATLSRCQKSFFWDEKEGKFVEPPWDVSEGPLLFNCQAIMSIACVRLFLPEFPFQRIVMITGTEEDMDEAAAAYVACPLERSPLFTKAAGKACQRFLTPIKIGHLLVRKTAAFSWSVEHAAAAWDTALFLTKWLHTLDIESSMIPPTVEEEAILSQMKNSLSEVDYPYSEGTSLAAAISRAWAPFLTDVWVWGITPKMGFAMERLAKFYEQEYARLCVDK
ncbi:hypothetical protein EK21DRAFT_114975 [Setomelanomma holmii]|uniref:C2H2-type domain-containing protein n=1 Tax=Setomelanomma holmii TaxID=210430 RepID=A0A9P4H4I0_9PLEO|nr:hypothetical protein EK21DRAFT_114975 [Setomelanomma holmii]